MSPFFRIFVVLGLVSVCLVSAWHPEKKVMKWSPTFFRPAANYHRMCGTMGSPCGHSQRQYSMFWRSTACCYGLECTDAGHGSFCSEPLDESRESLENEEIRAIDDRDSLEDLQQE